MLRKIVELSTDKASGETFVLVHFWREKVDFEKNKPWARKNEHIMQLRPTGVRIVTDENGWLKRKDGVFVDPSKLDPDKPEPEWERETYDRDLPAEIGANLDAYWERAEKAEAAGKPYPRDHTGYMTSLTGFPILSRPLIQRDNSDPHGVLARSDVTALRGIEVERP